MTIGAPAVARDERGFTLIELLVYSVLLVLVLGIVGSILISAITGQRRANEAAQTSQEAQLVMTSVGAGVRSATHVNTPTASSPLLVVERAQIGAAAEPICEAWLYSASDHTIRTLRRPPAVDGTTMTAADVVADGVLLASDVRQVDAETAVLQGVSASRTATVALSARTDRARQNLRSSFTSRQPAPTTGSVCF